MTHTIKQTGQTRFAVEQEVPTLFIPVTGSSLPAAVSARLTEWLGVRVQSLGDVAAIAHQGVKAKRFYEFQTQHQWLGQAVFDSVIAPSALSWARSRDEVLSPVETVKCIELMKVLAFAGHAFDQPKEVKEWFHTKAWDYQDKSPCDVLQQEFGADALIEDLQQVEEVCL